jgi:prepilin-type N-terminal cleavage/methylation domain-containing protein
MAGVTPGKLQSLFMRRQQRGFSLVELVVALVILTLVIMTTLVMMARRRDRLRQANETILVYQALANEVEVWRHVGFADLETEAKAGFRSDLALLGPLQPIKSSVVVKTERSNVKDVTLTIDWFNNERHASVMVVRSDTGGSNLW